MGFFSNIDKASSDGSGGTYFDEGQHDVLVNEIKTVTQKQGREDTFVIIDATIVESTSMKKGVIASQVINITGAKYPQLALDNYKNFLKAAYTQAAIQEQVDAPDDIDEDLAEYACSEDQPLAGIRLTVNCTEKPTKTGGRFTKHNWVCPSVD